MEMYETVHVCFYFIDLWINRFFQKSKLVGKLVYG